MAQSKSTKKFEKNRLKGVLDHRNSIKKTKQKQQLKARKKARRAEENGRDVGEEARPQMKGKKAADEALKDICVDDFFQRGFEVPELPKKEGGKRKRTRDEESDASHSDDSIPHEAVPSASDDGSDLDSEQGDFKAQLDALAKKDPEFHKVLQKDEPELFDELDELDELQLSEDDGDEPKRKKRKGEDPDDETGNELDMATVKKWRKALIEQHSLRAAKETVVAFRSAAYSADAEEGDFKYSVSDPDVYHELLTTALKEVPNVFQHHLPTSEKKSGKVHVATDSKAFKTLTPILRSQISGITQLLNNLSDAAALRLTLSSLLPLLPYLLSFKKLVRDVIKPVAEVWSTCSHTESTRIAAFLAMRRLVVIGDSGIREGVLKATYQALVKGARNTSIHTMPGVNLMKNSAAELWGLAGAEGGVAYTTAFTFIRSLAIHLRSSITHNANESYKTVYNWQFVHSLDFWGRVLATHCTDVTSPLQPLIYPLVQVTLGALRLIPTATYFPLRFQLIRSLLRISLATGTYVPLAAPLYEVLASAEMRKAPKPSTLKPLDFNHTIRAPQSYLRTRTYQDGVAEQVHELLSEFFVMWAKHIAFPELALPVTVMLRRWLKEVNSRSKDKAGNKNQKVNGTMQLLVQKLEANSRWIEERRAKVEFAPNDRRGVASFLDDVAWEKTPLGAYVVGQRSLREEKARIVDQGRKEEERRRQKETDSRAAADEEMESDGGADASDEDADEDMVDGDAQEHDDEDDEEEEEEEEEED